MRYYAVHHYAKGGKFDGYMIQKNLEGGRVRNIALVFKRRFVTFLLDLLNSEQEPKP